MALRVRELAALLEGWGSEWVLHTYLIIILLLINRHNNGPNLCSLGILTGQGQGSLKVPGHLHLSVGMPRSAVTGA